MKKILLASLALALSVGFYACKKNSDVAANPQTTNGLTASKTSGIELNEPVAFTFNPNKASSNAVTWQVIPDNDVLESVNGKKATFKFKHSGKYIITSSNGSINDSVLVNVDSTTYTGTDTTTTYQPVDSTNYNGSDTGTIAAVNVPIILNDQLSITATAFATGDSLNTNPGDSNITLQLSATTLQTYPSTSPYLLSTTTFNSAGAATINYTGVSFSQSSLTLTSPSVATNVTYLSFDSTTGASMPFSIVFNNITYSGSVQITGSTATITWPYVSGVVISPLVIRF